MSQLFWLMQQLRPNYVVTCKQLSQPDRKQHNNMPRIQIHTYLIESYDLVTNMNAPNKYCVMRGFHLHILIFPFVYQFNSRIGILVHSSLANDQFRRISTTFQQHFKSLLWFLYEKEWFFYTHLFCCTEMSSTAI